MFNECFASVANARGGGDSLRLVVPSLLPNYTTEVSCNDISVSIVVILA